MRTLSDKLPRNKDFKHLQHRRLKPRRKYLQCAKTHYWGRAPFFAWLIVRPRGSTCAVSQPNKPL